MNILCVDDEKMAVMLLEAYCREISDEYNFYGFTDAREALAFSEENRIDVALLDIDMPFISGIELAEKLKNINRYTNVIMTTAYTNYTMDAFELDCSGYLVKPISLEKLKHQFDVLRFSERMDKKVAITCNGEFRLLINNETPIFKYHKTFELLAYLVYKKGGLCSNSEIEVNLWDDDEKHSEYLKKLKNDLQTVLRYYGAEDIIITQRGYIRIDTDMISCDYLEYCGSNPKNAIPDCFFSDYKWAK